LGTGVHLIKVYEALNTANLLHQHIPEANVFHSVAVHPGFLWPS